MPRLDWDIRGGEAVVQLQRKIFENSKKQNEETTKAVKNSRELAAAQKRIWRDNAGPIEKYTKELTQAKELLDKNRISTEHYQRELSKLRMKYLDVGNASAQAQVKFKRSVEDQQQLLVNQAISLKEFTKRVATLRNNILGVSAATEEEARATAKLASERAKLDVKNNEKQLAARKRMIADATSKLNKEETVNARLRAEAARILSVLETPESKHKEMVLATGRLLRANVITEKQYVAIMRHHKAEVAAASDAENKLAESQRKRLAESNRSKKDTAEQRRLNKLLAESQAEINRKREAASRALQSLETPEERHKRNILQLGKLYRSAAISKQQFIEGSRRLTQEFERSKKAGVNSFAAVGRQLAGLVGISQGVYAAIGLIRSEIEGSQAAAERMSQGQLSVAESSRSLKLSVVGRKDIDPSTGNEVRRDVIANANRIAEEVGLSQTVVNQAVEEAVSASATPQRGVRFAEQGLRFTRGGEGTNKFVGGMLDIANALNLEPGNTDVAARKNASLAVGFLNEVRQSSRVSSTAKVAENVPRVINAFDSQGIDARTAAALFSGFSIAGADSHGDVSRTAAMNLLPRARKFFESTELGLNKEQFDTSAERLNLLMNDQKVADRFIQDIDENGGFRAAGRAAVVGFFKSQNSEARRAFRLNRERLSDFGVLERSASEGIGFLNSGNEDDALRANQSIAAGTERFRRSGRPTISQENLTNIRDLIIASGARKTRAFAAVEQFLDAGTDVDAAEAKSILEEAYNRRINPRVQGIGMTGDLRIPLDQLPESQQSAMNEMQTIIRQLGKVVANMEEAAKGNSIPTTGRQE